MKKLYFILIISSLLFILFGCISKKNRIPAGTVLKLGAEKDPVTVSISSLPEGYSAVLEDKAEIKKLYETLMTLKLTKTDSDEVNQMAGMTWVIVLSDSSGKQKVVYFFGKYIRADEDKQWYEMLSEDRIMLDRIFGEYAADSGTAILQYCGSEAVTEEGDSGYYTGVIPLGKDDIEMLVRLFSRQTESELWDCGFNYTLKLGDKVYRIQTRFRDRECYYEHEGKGFIVTGGDANTLISLCQAYTAVQKMNTSLPKEMPEDFSVRFEMWIIEGRKNILDTREGFIQKDLVANGIAAAGIDAENLPMEEIYSKLKLLCMDMITKEMTSAQLTNDNTMVDVSPLTRYSIQFTASGKAYTVFGDDTARAYIAENDEAARFIMAADYLSNVMIYSDEYKSLPEAEGGYD